MAAVGKRVEVLWKGEPFDAKVLQIHASGKVDVQYEIDGNVGIFLTAEKHGLKVLPDKKQKKKKKKKKKQVVGEKVCSEDACENRVHTKGLCSAHGPRKPCAVEGRAGSDDDNDAGVGDWYVYDGDDEDADADEGEYGGVGDDENDSNLDSHGDDNDDGRHNIPWHDSDASYPCRAEDDILRFTKGAETPSPPPSPQETASNASPRSSRESTPEEDIPPPPPEGRVLGDAAAAAVGGSAQALFAGYAQSCNHAHSSVQLLAQNGTKHYSMSTTEREQLMSRGRHRPAGLPNNGTADRRSFHARLCSGLSAAQVSHAGTPPHRT